MVGVDPCHALQIAYGSTIYYMANLRHGFDHYCCYMGIMILEVQPQPGPWRELTHTHTCRTLSGSGLGWS